jgi:hypothetical protein
VAVRLQFVPGREPPDLLGLPWAVPLAEWDHLRLVRMVRGPSRHVVRFVRDGERVYALKEMRGADAEREYAMLRLLAAERLPAVEAVGLVSGRATATPQGHPEPRGGEPLDAVLVTRYLDYSLPFHYLFSKGVPGPSFGRPLVDAGVVLLARLHLDGVFWGDCSLSNLLFRRDAGALMAYLVDAETAERHQPLPDGMRQADLELARENVVGGLLDLRAAGNLPADVDVVAVADRLDARYRLLWDELTGTEEVDAGEHHLIERRLRRLNHLGFDVDELVVEHDAAVDRLRIRPAVVEEGHHCREVRRLTGLEVQENQARRLLNDIASFGAHLSRLEGQPLPQAVVAARWIAEVYEPIVARVPDDLAGRLEPAELFHELLEHRYYLSEAAGHEVDNDTALASYLESVLRFRTVERVLLAGE